MNEPLDDGLTPQEAERIAELLHGHPADDAAALDRAGASSAVRARLAELRRVEAELAHGGARLRGAAVERARAAGPVPGEDRALDALRRAMASDDGAARAAHERTARGRLRAWPAWLTWLTAAAVLAALWLARGWLSSGDGDGGRGFLLGDSRTEGYAPRGSVAHFEVFEWPPATASASVQVVRAWAGERAEGPATVESPELADDESRWTPNPQERERLGARFVWCVVSIDALGRAENSGLVAVEVAP